MMGFIELHCNGRKVYLGVKYINGNPPMYIEDAKIRGSTVKLSDGDMVLSFDETAEEVAQKIDAKLLPLS